MGKLSFGRVLDCFCLSPTSNSSCFCMNSFDTEGDIERRSLIGSNGDQLVRLKDVVDGNQTLAFQLKPKMVVLRVSMHCNGCARKVEKHISKMEAKSSRRREVRSSVFISICDLMVLVTLLDGVKEEGGRFLNEEKNPMTSKELNDKQ